jgi:hypothetical protein
MAAVGGVLVSSEPLDAVPVALPQPLGWANPTRVLSLKPRDLATAAVYRATDAELKAVAVTLRAVLAINALTSPVPQMPDMPSGTVAYPAWAEIYYGPPVHGQPKRYVVVSMNRHNAATGRVLVVRLTSKAKRDQAGIPFPVISGGSGQACCGDLTHLPAGGLRHTPADGRPRPSRLSTDDMVEVIRGIRQTHGI